MAGPDPQPSTSNEPGSSTLPEDVQASLARALGVYVRSVPRVQLATALRPLKGFRPATLVARHGPELIAALDDPSVQDKVLRWLDDAPSRLSADAAEILRLAAERPEGWHEKLLSRSRETEPPPPAARSRGDERPDRSDREKLKRVREEARAEREAARRQLQAERARSAQLERKTRDLDRELERAREALEGAQRRHVAQTEELERRLRRAQRELERARAEGAELKAAIKEERRKLREATRQPPPPVEPGAGRAKRAPTPDDRPRERRSAGRRPRLSAPKGRFEDDPDTLDEWLTSYELRLLVDGYNVARAPGGYGDLSPEQWRQRLTDDLERYARAKGVRTTIVFDGQHVAPGTSRRRRSKGGLVEVEYSRPPEVADDHLVAVLEQLPPEPVIVVTDDRDLQRRVRKLGATTAATRQLLELIRR